MNPLDHASLKNLLYILKENKLSIHTLDFGSHLPCAAAKYLGSNGGLQYRIAGGDCDARQREVTIARNCF